MKPIFFIFLCLWIDSAFAQELYVYTEPASNMPAKSISSKLTSSFSSKDGNIQQRYVPEVMFGINKNLMLHAATTFSNMTRTNVGWESVYLYGKYRFLSNDAVHAHFRMAAFAEGGYSRNPLMYDELNVQGDVSGIQGGIIATQLVNKLAVSATTSYIKALRKQEEHAGHDERPTSVLNYTLSAGYLVLPRVYENYDQLNFNIYTELLAQHALDKKAYFIDAAPAIQFIFKSNSKLNLGYRFQLKGTAERNMQRSFLISFEHTFFNALRKKKKLEEAL